MHYRCLPISGIFTEDITVVLGIPGACREETQLGEIHIRCIAFALPVQHPTFDAAILL